MSDPLSTLKVNTAEYEIVDASARANKQDKLVSGTNIKTINGESVLGSGNITISSGASKQIWYGTCSTTATIASKVVTTTTGDFVLASGNVVSVKFTNAQSLNGAITLNVDGTGNVTVRATSRTATFYYQPGEVVDFIYDGTRFCAVSKGIASTTYYGETKLLDSTSSTSTALAATPNSVKTAYDLANSKQDALVSGTNIKTLNGNSLLGSGDIEIPVPADYVVEQTITEGWRVTKWNSGLLELVTSSQTETASLTTKMSDGVYSNSKWANNSLALPSVVNSIFGAWASVTSNGYTLCQVNTISSSSIHVRVWGSYSQTVSINVLVYARGTWK